MKDGSGAVSVSVTPRGNLCDGKFHVVTGMKSHSDIITQTAQHTSTLKCHILVLSSSSVQTA